MSPNPGERLAEVRGRLAAAARRSGREVGEIELVGVSKRIPASQVVAAVRAGLTSIGESYVQEARDKLAEVRAQLEPEGRPMPRCHFVGQLQRNKARTAADLFDVVHSVDRTGLGDELDRRAGAAGRRLCVLIQVDLSGEARKGGVSPTALPALVAAARAWTHLDVVGLMAIPAPAPDPRPDFARLRGLRDQLRGLPGGAGLRELSMGMSADFEQAVEEGATIVRVGTAIFGPRPT